MKGDAKILIGAIVVTVLLLVGGVVWVSSDKAPQRQDQGAATMAIDKKEEDFGSMKANEERTATFTITNTSTSSVLRIWGVATSCDCTFASVVIGAKTTGEFNMTMHMTSALKNWIGEVPPNDKALLKVTYRPKVMPVTGAITRQVNFSTNDPNNANVEVGIKANVL